MALRQPLLLLLIPVALFAVAWSLRSRGYGRLKIVLIGALRMGLAVAAILAAAGTSLLLPSPERTIVALVDGSPSYAYRPDVVPMIPELVDAQANDAIRRIELVREADPKAKFLVYRFDDSVRPVTDLERLRGVPIERDVATDIATAIETAGVAIPSNHAGLVLLFTDGIETRGDAASAARALGARDIPVCVIPSMKTFAADVRVASLDVPESVAPNQPFRISCRIESTQPVRAEFTLTRGREPTLRREVDVSPSAPALIETLETLVDEGLHVYNAHATFRGDRLRFNNELEASVLVGTRPLIVYLTTFEGETPVEKLLRGLTDFRFRRLTGEDDLTRETLADAALVVLDNFPADRLSRRMRELAAFVRDTGGGLVMIGGPASFGAGGYIETEIDKALPVRCDPRDADKTPLALVICLDASGSMGEGDRIKLRAARAAALQTLSRLTPADAAGVIVFRVTPETIVPLRPVADIDAVGRKLSAVRASGGTNIFPALAAAFDAVIESKAPLRHVVLLSDGQTQPGDVDEILSRFREAKVSLSTLATGDDADRALLATLAKQTGGRFYEAADIDRLPELFLDDLRRIEGPLVRTGDFTLSAQDPGELLKGLDLSSIPRVRAYNRTRLREAAAAQIANVFEDHPEPVLATGRAGLGRSAALTISFDSAWIGDFASWQALSDVIVRMVRDVARRTKTSEIWLEVRREGEKLHFIAHDERKTPATDEPLRLLVVLSALGGDALDIPLKRTAARRYEGHARVDASRSVAVATLVADSQTLDVRAVPGSYPAEFRSFARRMDVIEAIARLSGGRVVTHDADLLIASRPRGRERRDITSWLVALAFALFMVEIVGRALGRF